MSSLPERYADALLDDVISGRYPAGSALPPEGELAATYGISRLTLREAVRILRAKNVLDVRRGRGTFVNDPSAWSSLDVVIRASSHGSPPGGVSERLLEARRMVEVGAAQLAAQRRTDEHLDQMRASLAEMVSAADDGDVDLFVEADIAFHDAILRASGNIFVPFLLEPFGPLLVEARRQTSAVPQIQRNAIAEHERILSAIRSAAPGPAREAMESHMAQTQADLRRHVLATEEPDIAAPVPPEALTAAFPPAPEVDLPTLSTQVAAGRTLVVLDDDPTGTQSITDLPVLTRWSPEDLRWALHRGTNAFFVLTNSRSLPEAEAAGRVREIVRGLLAAAEAEQVDVAIASRSDSTLRGHFPLETDVLCAELAAAGQPVDGVVIVPAFVEPGRVTVNSVHWMRTEQGMIPVSRSEFARDATFGYTSADLRDWVEEKTRGRIPRAEVAAITLSDLRTGDPGRVADILAGLSDARPVVVDAVTDDDLRVLVLGLLAAEAAGKRFVYRTGPSFVRARSGQAAQPAVDATQLRATLTGTTDAEPGGEPRRRAARGLVVVGSHVGLTTRQLDRLRAAGGVTEVELDVPTLLDPARADTHVADTVERAVELLASRDDADLVVRTSRALVTGRDADDSLRIAGTVSAALVTVVRGLVRRVLPAFVLAKGGITSSDTATDGLGITRAWSRGTLLPGAVSIWEPLAGPACGIPYVVFAGNVGDDEALLTAIRTLRAV